MQILLVIKRQEEKYVSRIVPVSKMFFKCFHELSVALSRNSYQGKVLKQQLKLLSQMFYLRSSKQKPKGNSSSNSLHPKKTYTEATLCTNGSAPIKLYKPGVEGESICKSNTHTCLRLYSSPALPVSSSVGHSKEQPSFKANSLHIHRILQTQAGTMGKYTCSWNTRARLPQKSLNEILANNSPTTRTKKAR